MMSKTKKRTRLRQPARAILKYIAILSKRAKAQKTKSIQPKIKEPKIKWRAPATLKRTRKTWHDTWRLLRTLTLQHE